jgi:hypothetical protein
LISSIIIAIALSRTVGSHCCSDIASSLSPYFAASACPTGFRYSPG